VCAALLRGDTNAGTEMHTRASTTQFVQCMYTASIAWNERKPPVRSMLLLHMQVHVASHRLLRSEANKGGFFSKLSAAINSHDIHGAIGEDDNVQYMHDNAEVFDEKTEFAFRYLQVLFLSRMSLELTTAPQGRAVPAVDTGD
jgi:hypothetical protein